jgi:hypothetical protein
LQGLQSALWPSVPSQRRICCLSFCFAPKAMGGKACIVLKILSLDWYGDFPRQRKSNILVHHVSDMVSASLLHPVCGLAASHHASGACKLGSGYQASSRCGLAQIFPRNEPDPPILLSRPRAFFSTRIFCIIILRHCTSFRSTSTVGFNILRSEPSKGTLWNKQLEKDDSDLCLPAGSRKTKVHILFTSP